MLSIPGRDDDSEKNNRDLEVSDVGDDRFSLLHLVRIQFLRADPAVQGSDEVLADGSAIERVGSVLASTF